MLIEAGSLRDGDVVAADVCVLGAGAAGITLARALAGHRRTVSLIESGGLGPERDTQQLYDVTSVGVRYLPSRLRYFGGATNHWGGLCHVLDDEDFVPLPWIEHSGWPIHKADLEPHYERAFDILDIPTRVTFADMERDTDVYPRLLATSAFEPMLWLQSAPTRMGQKYRQEIADSDRIRCYLHANAVELVPDAAAQRIVQARTRTIAGKSLAFAARHYIVSAGGVENPRLLLASDSVVPGGLGNRYDLVGRYFMEHVFMLAGWMFAVPPPGTKGFQEEYVQLRGPREHPGVSGGLFGFRATPPFRRQHRLLGFSINALASARPRDASVEAVEELLAQSATVDRKTGQRGRSLRLIVFGECGPNPKSRIYLGGELDALGQRKAVVDLQTTPSDRRTVEKGVHAFAVELARSGHGRVKVELPSEDTPLPMAGGHHLGTTRMSDDPTRGVTDPHGRVHGLANLYLAGGSLFTTGGFANPTLTIVALALRQADDIERAMDVVPPEIQPPSDP